jgi:hypothetical protein
MSWIVAEWLKLRPYFALLDFSTKPASRVAWAVRVAVLSFSIVVLYKRLGTTTAPLLEARPPNPIPSEEIEDYRFRLPERTRREIYLEIATAELADRKRAIEQDKWRGHLWSREDDRGHFERVNFRAIALNHKLSLTQVYLILDEGLRNHWPGPDGETLPATTPPLDLRSTW